MCVNLIEKEKLTNIIAICDDIMKADISDGTIFYLYNPLFDFQYAALLNTQYQISLSKPIIVIAESRCTFFDAADWLEQYHFKDIDVIRKIKYYRSNSFLLK